VLGEQGLQVRLDAVLDQAGVDAEIVLQLAEDLLDGDDQRLAGPIRDRPHPRRPVGLDDGARRAHPIQRLVGAAVGVDQDTAVRLDHQQPGGQRQVGGEAPEVVDAAPSDHQPHGG
jgi:hypothetical protein